MDSLLLSRCCAGARWLLCCMAALTALALTHSAPLPFLSATPAMSEIPAGDFIMGFSRTPLPPSLGSAATFFPNGDADEQPPHSVSISAFRIAATETTNAQYELYDPSHKLLRGKYFFSYDDADAVLWVSHDDAAQYCSWLTTRLADGWTCSPPSCHRTLFFM